MTTASPKQERAAGTSNGRNSALAGLFVRKECWRLSLTGKLILLLIVIVAGWAGVRGIHGFLAVSDRANGEYLVVEAWIPRYCLEESITVFREGRYQKLLTSGCARLDDLDGRSTRNPAEAVAIELERYGMKAGSVIPVPCPLERKDRTYSTALAVKAWIEQSGSPVKAIDVVTLGPHARRSRLLFQKAFGDKVKVGVVAIEDRSYDSAHWWRSSEGVREVIGEGIAYIYARIFFHPSENTQKQ